MSTSHDPASASSTDGPIVEVDGEARLLGSLCPSCGTHEFPPQTSCARCGRAMDRTALPATGALWTWTVQRTRPKRLASSGEFEPFALGYVDLGPLKVATRLSGRDTHAWHIGDRVVLATPGAGATDTPPYWFEPEESQ